MYIDNARIEVRRIARMRYASDGGAGSSLGRGISFRRPRYNELSSSLDNGCANAPPRALLKALSTLKIYARASLVDTLSESESNNIHIA